MNDAEMIPVPPVISGINFFLHPLLLLLLLLLLLGQYIFLCLELPAD